MTYSQTKKNSAAEQKETDIFLSYKREDRPRVEPIVWALRSIGLKVWFDASLQAGEAFDEEIARELTKAKAHVVCWSNASVLSRWVRSEAHIGAGRNLLVPVYLEPCTPMPPFNLDHTVDLSEWCGEPENEAWKNVLSRIGSLLGRGYALQSWYKIQKNKDILEIRAFLDNFPNDPLNREAKLLAYEIETETFHEKIIQDLRISSDDLKQTAKKSTPQNPEIKHKFNERLQELSQIIQTKDQSIDTINRTLKATQFELSNLQEAISKKNIELEIKISSSARKEAEIRGLQKNNTIITQQLSEANTKISELTLELIELRSKSIKNTFSENINVTKNISATQIFDPYQASVSNNKEASDVKISRQSRKTTLPSSSKKMSVTSAFILISIVISLLLFVVAGH